MNFLLILFLIWPNTIETFDYQQFMQPQYMPPVQLQHQQPPPPIHHVQSHYFNNYLQLNDMILGQQHSYQSPYLLPAQQQQPLPTSSPFKAPFFAGSSLSDPFMLPKPQRARLGPSRRQFKFEETNESSSPPSPPNTNTKRECGILRPVLSNYVANGRTTPHTKWPWHVQIIIDGNDQDESETYCGGTLISKSFILTAAHCYDDLAASKRAKNTQILLNGINLPASLRKSAKSASKLLKFRAVNVILHPEYIPAMSDRDAEERGTLPGPRNDLALVEISISDQQVRDLVMPVCLPAAGYQLRTGLRCKIMGHGFMTDKDEDNFIMPNELQMADVAVSSNTACRNEVDSESIKSKINSDTICIRGPIHPCVGDSGGPLLCQGASKTNIHGDLSEQDEDDDDDSVKKWFLTGVTSFAVSTDENDKCGQFKSAVFGKVAHSIEWINRVTNNLA